MVKATIKSIRGHLGRTAATAMAVILGISFLSGTLIFSDSVQRAFDDLFATVFETTDANVRSTDVVDAGFGFQIRSRVDQSVIDTVAAVDGVAVAEGFVRGTATVVDADGEPIGNPGQGPPTLAFSWGEEEELSQFNITDGRAPTGPGEMALDSNTAEIAGFDIGDRVVVLSTSGSESFELVGVAKFGTSGSIGGATSALFELAEAQRILGAGTTVDAVAVRAEDGVSQQELTDRINAVLGDEAEAITGEAATEEAQDQIASGLQFFNIFLLVFAVIALIVSVFVIFNTFSILVAQRTRELALFRALGASQDQVVMSVFLEALVVGIIGSLIGYGLGIALSFGLQAGLEALGLELPSGGLVLNPVGFVISMIVGTLATVAAAVFPAIRAARITPIQALREASAESYARNNIRFFVGLGFLVVGAALILFGLLAPEISLAGLGVVVTFISVFIIGPSIARPVAKVLGKPIAAARGTSGKLARENSMRNPKRTARTAAALTIGVALVSGITVLASSLRSSIEDAVGDQFVGDFALDLGAAGGPGGGFSPDLTAELAAREETAVATGLRFAVGELEGDGDFIVAVDPDTAFDILDVGLAEGAGSDLTGETIFLSENRANDLDVGIGDSVSMNLPGLETDLTVAGIYTETAFVSNITIAHELWESTGAQQLDVVSYVKLNEGVGIADAKASFGSLVEPYPNVSLQNRDDYIENQSASIDQILNLIYGLLALAIIIAAFGIANTLRLSTIERTREIGLLRAVGMTRSQVQSTIRWEAVITAVFGAVLGIVLGLFFGYAIVVALRDQGAISFSVPVFSLVVVVVLAAVIGVLASIVPSIRASRLNILEAIATD